MKIIFEENYENESPQRVTLETDSVVIYDVLNDIKGALVALGFHPDLVKRAMMEFGQELEEAQENED